MTLPINDLPLRNHSLSTSLNSLGPPLDPQINPNRNLQPWQNHRHSLSATSATSIDLSNAKTWYLNELNSPILSSNFGVPLPSTNTDVNLANDNEEWNEKRSKRFATLVPNLYAPQPNLNPTQFAPPIKEFFDPLSSPAYPPLTPGQHTRNFSISTLEDTYPHTENSAHYNESTFTLGEPEDFTVDSHDLAPLTTNIPFSARSYNRNVNGNNTDLEYSANPIPIVKSPSSNVNRRKSIIENTARELRRVSLRVVNLANLVPKATSPHVRLPDDEPDDITPSSSNTVPITGMVPMADDGPLEGKSLGIFGKTNPFRVQCRRILLYKLVLSLSLSKLYNNVIV